MGWVWGRLFFVDCGEHFVDELSAAYGVEEPSGLVEVGVGEGEGTAVRREIAPD